MAKNDFMLFLSQYQILHIFHNRLIQTLDFTYIEWFDSTLFKVQRKDEKCV
jgi:hypothetical protein